MTSVLPNDGERLNGSVVKVPKMAELVATDIRRRIVRGELPEGTSLPPEAEMMAHYGVSRPTLREALRVLESEQLVIPRRGSRGGAKINVPTTEVASRYLSLLLQVRGATYGELYDLRLILEPPAARLLAKQRPKAGVDALRKVYDEEEASLDNPAKFFAASARFHEQVVELSGSTPLGVFAEVLSDLLERQHATSEAADDDTTTLDRRMRRAHSSHRQLLDLLEARDADGAEKFWTEHLEGIGRYYRLGSAQPLDVF